MDRIFLRDLNLVCTIGVNDWEREIRQPVSIDIDLHLNLRPAGNADDLNRSVDYQKIRDRIEIIVTQSSFLLIEALAEKIAGACLEYENIRSVRVSVEKPGALRSTRSVGVEVWRDRENT